MDDPLSIWIITITAIIFSAFFSGTEIAFITSNRVRAEIDVTKGGLVSRIINLFYSHEEMFISALLVGNNIVLVVYGMGMAKLLEPALASILGNNDALVLFAQTVISTGLILITGEFLPKSIFRINPNDTLHTFAVPLYLCYLVLYPIAWFSSALSSLLMKISGVRITSTKFGHITVRELDAYLQETIEQGEETHTEVENEVKLFQNALEFSSIHLRDCMIPRNEIVAVDIDTTSRDKLARMFNETGLSKFIVYRDNIDEVLGYIHVCELFTHQKDWKDCIKPVMFAPETMLAKKQMRKLLSAKRSIAIVVDEFGGTAGMVTLEDLFEEIFGDIEDEHDRNRKKLVMKQIDADHYELSGRLEIETINDTFHLDIPENDDYQTLAGYLLYNLEALPDEGETFLIDHFTFSILKKTAAKIELVSLTINHDTTD